MNCHTCGITALGGFGLEADYTGLVTHGHLGLCSSAVLSKAVLHEWMIYFSADILAEGSAYRAKIDKSLATGTLGRFGRCLRSAAIQKLAAEVAQEFASSALARLEKILLEDEAAKVQAIRAAEAAARERARLVAKEAAEETAKMVAREVAAVVAESIAKSVADSVARSVADSVADSVAKSVADSVARSVAKSVADSVARSVAKSVAEPPAVETATRVATDIAMRTIEEFETKQTLNSFVSHQLSWLQHISQETIRVRVDKASKNAPAVTRKFHIPQQLAVQVPQLALYDFIIVCDNSKSMTTELSRKLTLRASVCGLFRILDDLGSDRPFSILPYIGQSYTHRKSEEDVNDALDSIKYGGSATGANASIPLQQIVLPQLEDQAKKNQLNPTVVVVITDGNIGDVSTFGTRISQFKTVLRNNNYNGPAALFLICRVGSDEDEAKKLARLSKNKDIRDMILYSEDQLDSRLDSMQNNIDEYTGYVVGKLLDAMKLQLIQA